MTATDPGSRPGVQLDAARVRLLADRYREVAEQVTAARAQLRNLTFGGAVAGRAHMARGEALRRSATGLDTALGRWSESAAETAALLARAAGEYAASDRTAAGALRSAGVG